MKRDLDRFKWHLDNLDWINILRSLWFIAPLLVLSNNLPDSIPKREENIHGNEGGVAHIKKTTPQRVRTYNYVALFAFSNKNVDHNNMELSH